MCFSSTGFMIFDRQACYPGNSCSFFCLCLSRAGQNLQGLNADFWSRRGVPTGSPDDVVLRSSSSRLKLLLTTWIVNCARTKQWMSDNTWQQEMFLFLPAAIANNMRGTSPPGNVL